MFDEVLDAMGCDELVLHLCFEPPTLELNILLASVGQLINPDVAVVIRAHVQVFLPGISR